MIVHEWHKCHILDSKQQISWQIYSIFLSTINLKFPEGKNIDYFAFFKDWKIHLGQTLGHILGLNGRDISFWIWLVICSILRILWLTNQNQADKSVVKYLYIMAIKLYNSLLSQETDYLCCCASLRSCIILQAFSSYLIK